MVLFLHPFHEDDCSILMCSASLIPVKLTARGVPGDMNDRETKTVDNDRRIRLGKPFSRTDLAAAVRRALDPRRAL